MYAFGGMKISVIPTGLCMLTMPRECAKSNAPVSVNDTDMPCVCMVVVAAMRAVWPAVLVTAAARLLACAVVVPQPAARTLTLTLASTTRYLPPRIASALRPHPGGTNSVVPGSIGQL